MKSKLKKFKTWNGISFFINKYILTSFGNWEFYCNTSLAHVLFKRNKLLKNILNKKCYFIFDRYRPIGQLRSERQCLVTGPPHPLAGSVERPPGSVHRHDVASEVSSVPPWSHLQTNVPDPYPTQKYGSHILRVWPNRSYSARSLWREVSTSAKARVVLQNLLSETKKSFFFKYYDKNNFF